MSKKSNARSRVRGMQAPQLVESISDEPEQETIRYAPDITALTTTKLPHGEALFAFQEHDVVISKWVRCELESVALGSDAAAQSARKILEYIEVLVRNGSPEQGDFIVPLSDLSNGKATGNLIITQSLTKYESAVIVSESSATLIEAWSSEKPAQRFAYPTNHILEKPDPYNGPWIQEDKHFLVKNSASPTIEKKIYQVVLTGSAESEVFPGQHIICDDMTGKEIVLEIQSRSGNVVRARQMTLPIAPVCGIQGRNIQQQIALAHLLDTRKKLVVLVGPAGSGKTLLPLAYWYNVRKSLPGKQSSGRKSGDSDGLQMHYVYSTRPISPYETERGALPGDMREKDEPYLKALRSAHTRVVALCGQGGLPKLLENSVVPVRFGEAAGVSLTDHIFVDEIQRFNKLEVAAIGTRLDEAVTAEFGHSKLILSGDPSQILRTKEVTPETCGLMYTLHKLRKEWSPEFAVIVLPENQRGVVSRFFSGFY